MHYLLIIDASGNLALADADKGTRMPIGRPLVPAQQSRVSSAVWSPEGQWTAWSVDSDVADGVREIRFHDEATDQASVLAESLSAFYMCPSPSGRYLSHLSLGPLGLELAISDIASAEIQLIERGQPLFWAWSPGGEDLAVHVENRLVVANCSGRDVRVLNADAGAFTCPWWLPGGSVAYAVEDRIDCARVDGSITTLVAQGSVGRFSVDPDGRRLTYIDGAATAFRLVVLDLVTGDVEEVTSLPTAAFFWSPTGHRLAALVAAGSDEVKWLVFDGSEVVELAPFRPSRAWIGAVLPFFEQYAQSHQCWSIDGTRLVAPAVDEAGMGGALVQEVIPPNRTTWLADADLAWWA